MPATGTPSFDAISVVTIEMSFTNQLATLKATGVYVNTQQGTSHGQVSATDIWSSETRALILQLRQAMEDDFANKHFVNHTTQTARGLQVTGIGEFLEKEVPSV